MSVQVSGAPMPAAPCDVCIALVNLGFSVRPELVDIAFLAYWSDSVDKKAPRVCGALWPVRGLHRAPKSLYRFASSETLVLVYAATSIPRMNAW